MTFFVFKRKKKKEETSEEREDSLERTLEAKHKLEERSKGEASAKSDKEIRKNSKERDDEHGDAHIKSLSLKRFWVSEKATALGRYGKYVFAVGRAANKSEVRKEVERMFKVNVIGINMIRREGKIKRTGRALGRRPFLKKAIVTLRKGDKIETL